MEKPFNKDWCRQTYEVLIFLDKLYDKIESQNSLQARDPGWGDDPFSDKISAASISFEIKVKRRNRRGSDLWVGVWFTEEAPISDRPIWILILRDDKQMWTRFKNEFSDAYIFESKEYSAIGLAWPLPADAIIEQVKSAGEDLANRLIRVLIPNETM